MKSLKFNRTLLLFFSLIFLASCAKEIVDLTGDIKGIVKDANDGHLIENCLVTITPGNASVSTSQAGIFEFVDLEPGEYTLAFKKVGYPEHSQIVSVITGKVKNLDVLMKSNAPFAVSESMIDFADFSSTKEFYVVNNSDGETSFEISNIPTWLQLSRTKGTVNATSQLAISATVDRNSVDYGEYSQNIVISYKGRSNGEVLLPIKFKKVRLTTPEVECDYEAYDVTQNSFNIKGKILSTGGSVIYAHGHCWSTHENPTINDAKTDLRERQETGVFASSVTGLFVNTTYFVRAYAQNAQGITYSDQVAITTQDTDSDKWDGKKATSFAGGSGTRYDPYIIRTGGQLLLMNDYGNEYFKIDGDIDLNNKNWKPIEKFSGVLDGNGHTIYNLRVERDDISYRGLIGNLYGGTVKNLTIRGVTINGDYAGAVAGRLTNTATISNCNVVLTDASSLRGSYVGGVVGSLSKYLTSDINTVEYCTVESLDKNVSINGNHVGGIVGHMSGDAIYHTGVVTNCSVDCDIVGEDCVGGIAGYAAYDLTIENCAYNGNISGTSDVGGICGYSNTYVLIVGCKATAAIEGEDQIGGICGGVSEIVACYSHGTIKASASASRIGGICSGGINAGSVTLCYSAMTCSHRSYLPICSPSHAVDSYSVYDTDDIALKMEDDYSDYAHYWDFDNTWTWTGTVDGKQRSVRCPRLAWEE